VNDDEDKDKDERDRQAGVKAGDREGVKAEDSAAHGNQNYVTFNDPKGGVSALAQQSFPSARTALDKSTLSHRGLLDS